MMNKRIQKFIDKHFPRSNSEKFVLLTGGNSGIGFEAAKYIVYLGYNLIIASRNIDRINDAIDTIKREYPYANILAMKLDLANKESIDSFVKAIKQRKLDIGYIINNAGIFRMPYSLIDNKEIHMAVNAYGTYYLMSELQKYLNNLNHQVKIIFNTSFTAYIYKIDYDHFNMSENEGKMKRYAKSKIAVTHIFNYFLNQNNNHYIYYLFHPGATYTPLITKGYKNKLVLVLAKIFMKIFFHSPSVASLGYLYIFNDIPNASYIVPRGFLELSGKPKLRKINKKQIKDYDKTINYLTK